LTLGTVNIVKNRIRKVIKEGGAALGAGALTFNPNVIEVLGNAGLDFVWLDLEHTGHCPFDSVSMENLIRAADNVDIATLVRVPTDDDHMIGKLLDAGAQAILVPGLSSVEEVRHAVSAAKYSLGGRGTPLSRATGFRAPDQAFAEQADQDTMIGIMIENKALIDNLDKVLMINGLDFGFIGPSDLSISLGVPFQTSHPKVKEYISKALELCKAKGIPVGYPVSDLESARKAIREGCKLLRIGVDLQVLHREFSRLIQQVKQPPA